MSASDAPKLNKEVSEFFQASKTWAKDRMQKLLEKQAASTNTNFPIYLTVIFVLLACGVFYYLYKASRVLETPDNIGRIARDSISKNAHYSQNNPNRLGIREYLTKLRRSGVPENHLVFTNFYVSTVNAGGIFFPVVDGVVSPEAVRAAILGGARCFVFDIWPDLSPGAGFGPVIQTVESGSLWRRMTINSLPFSYLLKVLIEEAFELNSRPGYYDPLILYLRFRGSPRKSTFNLTAQTLAALVEQYRLPNVFNRCRNQDALFSSPITDLFRKVIIASNVNAEGTSLRDYINIGPKVGVKMEYTTNEARGLNAESIAFSKRIIQQNLTWVAPLSEDASAEGNSWDFKPSMDLGIMFCAMNFWDNNDKLKAYMKMFGTQSFAIKPEPLRYVLEVLPTPPNPQNPGWVPSPTAGTPVTPPGISLP